MGRDRTVGHLAASRMRKCYDVMSRTRYGEGGVNLYRVETDETAPGDSLHVQNR